MSESPAPPDSALNEPIETTDATDAARQRITERPAEGAKQPTKVERGAKTVQVKDLNLFYGTFHAVQDVDMTIEPNKVTALIGSSGCGKTTFLRSINRMHELTPGAS